MPQMNEIRITKPRRTRKTMKRHRPRNVLLAPTNKPRVHRDLQQCFSTGDNEPAAGNATVRLLVKLGPWFPRHERSGAFRGQPVNRAMRFRPRSSKLNSANRLRQSVSDTIRVGQNDYFGVGLRNAAANRLGLNPALAGRLGDNYLPSGVLLPVVTEQPSECCFPVRASRAPRDDNGNGHLALFR